MAELDPDLNGAEGDESFFMDSSTNNDTKDQSGLAGDNEADDPVCHYFFVSSLSRQTDNN